MTEDKLTLPIYPIGVAAQLLGVHPRTLRLYEKEGLIKPHYRGSRRFFSQSDLQWISCLRTLIHEKGISIPGLKMLIQLTPCWTLMNCPPDRRQRCQAYENYLPETCQRCRQGSSTVVCDTCDTILEATGGS